MPRIADIMTHPVRTVGMDDSLDLIRRIFDETGFHHLVVREDRKPVGVVSDRDLLRHLSPFIGNDLMERPQDVRTLRKRAHQIMHRDLITVGEHDSLESASNLLLKHRVGCLPVVDEQGHLKGIVTWRDLLPHCQWDCNDGEARAA